MLKRKEEEIPPQPPKKRSGMSTNEKQERKGVYVDIPLDVWNDFDAAHHGRPPYPPERKNKNELIEQALRAYLPTLRMKAGEENK